MRSTSRAVVLATATITLLSGAGAVAQSADVDKQEWVAVGPLAPAAPADGNVYVSVAAGQEQARTYLTLADPATRGIIRLTEASDSVASNTAVLLACALSAPFTGAGAPPEPDCEVSASVTRSASGDWELPLVGLGGALQNGIAVVADTSSVGTSTVSFDTSRTECECESPAPAESLTAVPAETPAASEAPTTIEPAVAPEFVVAPIPDGIPPVAGAPTPPTPTTAASDADVGAPRDGRAGLLVPERRPRSADAGSPPAVVILVPLVLTGLILWTLRRRRGPSVMPDTVPLSARAAGLSVTAVALAFLLLTASESVTFRLGFIAIVFIGAIGLHILVNWAGELSLGHAAFIGLPAFFVAQAASHSGLSPILFVPLGIAIGVLLGLIVASAALRARGLQVSLVTLAIGIACIRFFFVRSWVIGPPTGLKVPTPSLFGWELQSNRALIWVLAVLVAVAAVSARWILGSKLGRAFAFIRSEPAAASAAGIPVNQYRAMAYAFAGAYAGLAGAAYVVWVQRMRPEAFPLTLGFTYLVIAVLAGRGGLGGLALSVGLVQGGALFAVAPSGLSLYLGPLALIVNATRYQKGFNGGIAALNGLLKRRLPSMEQRTIRVQVAVGILAMVAGFSAVLLAWYHSGNTDQQWVQNQELISGGIGGLGLIILGSTILIRDALLNIGKGSIGRALQAPSVGADDVRESAPPDEAPDTNGRARPLVAAGARRTS